MKTVTPDKIANVFGIQLSNKISDKISSIRTDVSIPKKKDKLMRLYFNQSRKRISSRTGAIIAGNKKSHLKPSSHV
nr:hypothetical protein [Flavobacterium supellecticarium]